MKNCTCCGRPVAPAMTVPWRAPKSDAETLALLATFEGFAVRRLDAGALGWWLTNRTWEEVHEMRMAFFRAWRTLADDAAVSMVAHGLMRVVSVHGLDRARETGVLLNTALGLTPAAEGR